MSDNAFNYVLAQFGVAGVVLVIGLLALYRLGADLARLRTDLQQQVARELLNRRFASYGRLWAAMKPLAIFSDDPLTPAKTEQLSQALSDWYFSAEGGMYLTEKARDFYFALQEVLTAAAELKGWRCTHRPDNVKKTFETFVSAQVKNRVFDAESLKHPETMNSENWHELCRDIGKPLRALPTSGAPAVNDTVFATLQQVSSALRTILSHELHTRLETRLARP